MLILCCICLLGACNEKQPDGKKPDPIVNYNVTPINGGATITYSIPSDPNILYVMAEYVRNGKPFTERSSTYVNSLTIEGFNTMEPVSATLYTVNDNEIKSDPLPIHFTPLESPVSLVRKSANIIAGFGGIYVSWTNIAKAEMGLRLMVYEEGEMVEKEMYFSSLQNDNRPFRGFDNVETLFALTFEDPWGNISDTAYFKGIPLPEFELEKPWTDVTTSIPFDNVSTYNANTTRARLWSNQIGVNNNSHYHTANGSRGSSFTFDFGQVVKLSRMQMWPFVQMTNISATVVVYGNYNVLSFEMWGAKTLDPAKLAGDRSYWLHPNSAREEDMELPEHTFMDDWVYLGRYEIERLDFIGVTDDVIYAKALEGYQFDLPIECDPVRFIRFFPLCDIMGCPVSGNWWRIQELSFWGDNTISQEIENEE